MLTRQPDAALRHARPHDRNVVVGLLQADLEIAVGAVAGERVVGPGGGKDGGGLVRSVVGGVMGKAGEVRVKKGREEIVVFGLGPRGKELGDVD